MRLIDLEPEWEAHPDKYQEPATLTAATAAGMSFLCPCARCRGNGQMLMIYFSGRGVHEGASPGPGRWDVIGGNDFSNLTLQPSIVIGDNHWHGWIRNGEVTDA